MKTTRSIDPVLAEELAAYRRQAHHPAAPAPTKRPTVPSPATASALVQALAWALEANSAGLPLRSVCRFYALDAATARSLLTRAGFEVRGDRALAVFRGPEPT
jgi:hypothetical protein